VSKKCRKAVIQRGARVLYYLIIIVCRKEDKHVQEERRQH
jgi:adenine-specific DNA methylase